MTRAMPAALLALVLAVVPGAWSFAPAESACVAAGTSCAEAEVESAEEQLIMEMQVGLLQKPRMDVRMVALSPAAEGSVAEAGSEASVTEDATSEQKKATAIMVSEVSAEASAAEVSADSAAEAAAAGDAAPQQGCQEDRLVGTWRMENALGIPNITVVLTVHPKKDQTCGPLAASISFIGQQVEYVVTVRPSGGKLAVRYTNEKAQPVYFHEGTFDPVTDQLTEDLTHVDGKPAPPGGLAGVLAFTRLAA